MVLHQGLLIGLGTPAQAPAAAKRDAQAPLTASTAGFPPDSGVKMSLIMVKKNSTPLQGEVHQKSYGILCSCVVGADAGLSSHVIFSMPT